MNNTPDEIALELKGVTSLIQHTLKANLNDAGKSNLDYLFEVQEVWLREKLLSLQKKTVEEAIRTIQRLHGEENSEEYTEALIDSVAALRTLDTEGEKTV
jgi:hypothetical protein